jgi:hypothetical protein
MGRILPVLWLLALAGCGTGKSPAPAPVIVSAPSPTVSQAPAVPQPQPLSLLPPSATDYTRDVDALLRQLAATDAYPEPPQPADIARGVSALLPAATEAPKPGDTIRAAYQANLEVCLDGHVFAFCQHEQLSPYDATLVQQAEYQANLVTCIDPEWQHLCRPELLPDTMPEPPATPVAFVARRLPLEAVRAGRPEPTVAPARFLDVRPPRSAPIESRAPAAAIAAPKLAMPPTSTASASARTMSLSATAIAHRLIAASIAEYPGRCPCPYIRDRAGRRCGARSAYTRPGGYGPLCFAEDVTPAMIENYQRIPQE